MTYELLPNGAFARDMAATYHYPFDPCLARALVDLFSGQSVVDFGAGPGKYVRAMIDAGIDAAGVDAVPEIETLTQGLVTEYDLANIRGQLPCPAPDWALCLEVLEHIPAHLLSVALENLHRHNRRGIVLSWAIPGQGGDGHVSEQHNAFAIEWFTGLGYRHDQITQAHLRMAVSDLWWFANSLMVFRRK